MDALIKTKPQDDPVYMFLDKKRAQGKPYYQFPIDFLFAGCLVHLISMLHHNGNFISFES